MRREDLESPDDKWTVFFPFPPIHSNMMLFAVVCMSARMGTAPICACCDAACARIASVDMRADAVVVHIAPSVCAAMLSVHALHLSVLAVMLLTRAQCSLERSVLL
jgi:hypothetical protein